MNHIKITFEGPSSTTPKKWEIACSPEFDTEASYVGVRMARGLFASTCEVCKKRRNMIIRGMRKVQNAKP